jgi:hypothetical protein
MNKIYDKLTALDFAIVALYLVILLVIGYVASVRQKKKNETLFLASHSLNWYNIGFNMWGTNVGPSHCWHLQALDFLQVLWEEILNGMLLFFCYC